MASSSWVVAPAASPTAGFDLSAMKCRVHPSVILTMLDAHTRLEDANTFAIGTLLGTTSTEGKGAVVLVDVVDCFANTYTWDSETCACTIQREPHEWMLKLKEKINPKLSVVGW